LAQRGSVGDHQVERRRLIDLVALELLGSNKLQPRHLSGGSRKVLNVACQFKYEEAFGRQPRRVVTQFKRVTPVGKSLRQALQTLSGGAGGLLLGSELPRSPESRLTLLPAAGFWRI
jgi:hypothetical protein